MMSTRYNIYFNGFIFCEFLNFAIVLLQFVVTHQFLSRRFLLYGLEVILILVWISIPRISNICDCCRFGAITFSPQRSSVFLSSKTQCAKLFQG